MEVLTVMIAISTMGVMIGLGVAVAKKIEITAQSKQLLMFVIINLAVPAIILSAVLNTEITDDIFRQVFIVFIASIAFHTVGLFLALGLGRLFHFRPTINKQLAILSTLGNVGFIGIPLSTMIFGPIGGLLAAVFDAGLDVVAFSLGVIFLQGGHKFRFGQLKALINTPLIAITLSLIFVTLNVEAPFIVKHLMSLLSGLAAPLAMLYIGFLIYPFIKGRKSFFYRELFFPVLMKLLFFPIIFIFFISLFPMETMIKQLLIIQISMPTFMLASILFSRYTNHEEKAVVTIIVSTILSLLTVPFISLLTNIIL